MPTITQEQRYNGVDEKIRRLGLLPLWNELLRIVTDFQLLVQEQKDTNGGAALRALIDQHFWDAGGWEKKQTGDIDFKKCLVLAGISVCIGVEIQCSGRSDLLVIDVAHLRTRITEGHIDVGVIVVPSDKLAIYLTDRGANFTAAVQAVARSRAEDLPLIILGLEHDGPGPALPKRTRQ